ncbi:MAG: hypothetical protein LBS72_03040, partial [Oscillospiraceae bacterium]|nr:hypothetical protein [Oscillospiraceae bacterium]
LRVNPPPPVADEGGLERATPRWIKRQCIQTERFFEHALSRLNFYISAGGILCIMRKGAD